MNAPPGFESDSDIEGDSEDESPAVTAAPAAAPSNQRPKFSWKSIIREPVTLGSKSKLAKTFSLGSLITASSKLKRADVVEGLNAELDSPSTSPTFPSTAMKKAPTDAESMSVGGDYPSPAMSLEDLQALLELDPSPPESPVASSPTAVAEQPAPAPDSQHPSELGQFLGVLGQFLVSRMQSPTVANLGPMMPYAPSQHAYPSQGGPGVPQTTANSAHEASSPGIPAYSAHRPTWIPTHRPTLASYDAVWANHPPVPTWPPSVGSQSIASPYTPLPGFSTLPPTPAAGVGVGFCPPPFCSHPAYLMPHHSYYPPQHGESRGYYDAPMSPSRLHTAEAYLPNPNPGDTAGKSGHTPSQDLGEPQRSRQDASLPASREEPNGEGAPGRSRTRSIVNKVLRRGNSTVPAVDPVAQPHATLSREESGRSSRFQTIATCIAIAKELQHVLRTEKQDSRSPASNSKPQRLGQTLEAVHGLITVLKEHPQSSSDPRSLAALSTVDHKNHGDIIQDVLRYLKGLAPYLTPELVMTVIYLVKDWLDNGFTTKGLIRAATGILEELNHMSHAGAQSGSMLNASHQNALHHLGEELLRHAQTAVPSLPNESQNHSNIPSSRLSDPRRQIPQKTRAPSPSTSISTLDLNDGPSHRIAKLASANSPSISRPNLEQETRTSMEITKQRTGKDEQILPPVPPPRLAQRSQRSAVPSQSAIDALKAKQRLKIERAAKSADKTVHLSRVGLLPPEDLEIHDGVTECAEGEADVQPGTPRRVASDLQAARALASANSGPSPDPMYEEEGDVVKKGPSARQVAEATQLLKENIPLYRGVIPDEDRIDGQPRVMRYITGEPRGLRIETQFEEPGTPREEASPAVSSPFSPLPTPLETPYSSPLASPILDSDNVLDIDDLRDELEYANEMRDRDIAGTPTPTTSRPNTP